MRILSLLLFAAVISIAADPATVRATLQPAKHRAPAPAWSLDDASGHRAALNDYRGKIVIIDFWATWCHGCKEEIPFFADLARKYGASGLAVIGISQDEGGWSVLKPFLASANIPYRTVLGGDPVARAYRIESLPDTFLIDRKGRLAASYTGGLVDKENLEANIKTMLTQR